MDKRFFVSRVFSIKQRSISRVLPATLFFWELCWSINEQKRHKTPSVSRFNAGLSPGPLMSYWLEVIVAV
ncbi:MULTISPECIES: hypothetical protein [unclassified Pseudomonas]|uniref:hypothetical protein n=1 Tax=unclassified Pseudomonas TaxID=196821 RepID=UPI0011AECDBC|nr:MULTISPECIES: hypothetical protein [unclassified Pseudomonas]